MGLTTHFKGSYSRYTFIQFITALEERLQLREEVDRANALDAHYGQYMNNPTTVWYPNNRALYRANRWWLERNRSLMLVTDVHAPRMIFEVLMPVGTISMPIRVGRIQISEISSFVMDVALLTIF